jgi:transcriptional regulator PpsR
MPAASAARLVAAASDVALVVDRKGVVRDVAFGREELSQMLDGKKAWRGARMEDTVSSSSQPKVAALLKDAIAQQAAVWRQVNHPSADGEVPVMYAAVDIGRDDRFLMVGRDLRQVAQMQQRLVEAQQSLERDYVRLREADTRYRLLFQVASEAVLVVDAADERVLDANPAALALLQVSAPQLIRSPLADQFVPADHVGLRALLAELRASGRMPAGRLTLAHDGAATTIAASLFRQDGALMFLVRLSSHLTSPDVAALKATALLQTYFDAAADGFVITDADGRVARANVAFLEMAQLSSREQARGEPLDRWLGRAEVDLGIALANLRQNGTLKLFATVIRGEFGSTAEVEVSGVALGGADGRPNYGFTIRNVEKRLAQVAASKAELPRSIAQLTELIGRVPLRDLVRETTDVIERLSIEAALELTGNNRASAAEMLGLSRQSLYVKLRRYGIDDTAGDDDGNG